MKKEKLLSVARGNAPADLLLVNASIVNTFTGEIETGNVAISQGVIAGVGDYQEGNESLDLNGRYLCPGLINGHVHLEDSYLTPGEYARAVVPRGVLAVVTDFHEIANVCGMAGIRYILKWAEKLPLDVFGMAPSCVPATNLETAGARIDAAELEELMHHPKMIGLGEMMNFPGLIAGESSVWEKVELFKGKVIDGHSPGLRGKDLNAYISAGIQSDHECTELEEAREKLQRGMHIMIREGSSEKNLESLLPLVTDKTYKRCFFVGDDRDCADLLYDGDIDAVVRKAIKQGLDPIRAIQLATINTVEYFGLRGLGAIAPGYQANFIVLDDLADMKAGMVFYHGRLVAQDGEMKIPIPDMMEENLAQTVNVKPFEVADLRMPAKGDTSAVIEIVPDQIITRHATEKVRAEDGYIQADIERDILKLVVVERHHATGNIGVGLVKGFGLKRGALASSVAHDSHNIIAVGTNDDDMFMAIMELARIQGGFCIAVEGQILGLLGLPIAGLLSEELLTTVVLKFEELEETAIHLGCKLQRPIDTLSFLALPVIPEIRLTDKGLVDVLNFKFVEEDR